MRALFEPLSDEDPGRVGRFLIRARLGVGGMGRVYLASTESGRPVAVKVMRPDFGLDPEFRERFRQEVEAARRVHGFYTAQVLDSDPDAPQPWLATVYVAAPSLHEVVRGHGALPETSVLSLMAGIGEALQAIHEAGIVHRDLKPSNVLLAGDGPRVIDFGIARMAETTALTRHGMLVGTPGFMAPEQVLGAPIAPALDVFALGSTAAFAAQGYGPFGDDGIPVLHRVANESPALDGCPPLVRAIIERCLAKDPAKRPTPGEIIADCQRALAELAPEPDWSWLPGAVAATVAERAADPMLPPAPPSSSPPPASASPLPASASAPLPQPHVPSTTLPLRPSSRPRRRTLTVVLGAGTALAAIAAAVAYLLPGGDPNAADTTAGKGGAATERSSSAPTSAPAHATSTAAASTTPTAAADTAATTAASTPSTPTPPSGPWYAGTWSGTVYQPIGTVTEWTVVITLPAQGTAGTFAAPSLGCSGPLEVTSTTTDVASLKDHITSNPRQICVNGLMTLNAAGTGHASFTWQDVGNAQNVGTAPMTQG
jgi:serine/threonine protein kinase